MANFDALSEIDIRPSKTCLKADLKRSEHKSLQTDRVILVPGPEAEVQTVRWIYSRFPKRDRSESEIAFSNEEMLDRLTRLFQRHGYGGRRS